jgi:glycine/D-amino acid oxidase-like deaminating enzyme
MMDRRKRKTLLYSLPIVRGDPEKLPPVMSLWPPCNPPFAFLRPNKALDTGVCKVQLGSPCQFLPAPPVFSGQFGGKNLKKIIIVGAGIIGAALASRLARMACSVSVLDKSDAGVGIATARSWAWLNASWGNPEPYYHLRAASLAEWRRMADQISGVSPIWCGSLSWDLPETELRHSVPILSRWGYNVRLVDAATARHLEPSLKTLPDVSVHAPDEGAIEPVVATKAMLRDAEAHGARLSYNAEVLRLAHSGGKVTGVVLNDGSEIAADEVILASGTGVAALAEPLGQPIPVDAPPGLLATTEPLEKVLNGLLISPLAHVRQRPDGSLIAGTDFAGADPGNDPDGVANEIVNAVAKLIKSETPIRLASWTVGHRPTPQDGVSIAGRVMPGLTVAVTHSGVTLAPILGKLLANELVTGERDPLMAPFGPDRFAGAN